MKSAEHRKVRADWFRGRRHARGKQWHEGSGRGERWGAGRQGAWRYVVSAGGYVLGGRQGVGVGRVPLGRPCCTGAWRRARASGGAATRCSTTVGASRSSAEGIARLQLRHRAGARGAGAGAPARGAGGQELLQDTHGVGQDAVHLCARGHIGRRGLSQAGLAARRSEGKHAVGEAGPSSLRLPSQGPPTRMPPTHPTAHPPWSAAPRAHSPCTARPGSAAAEGAAGEARRGG